MNWYEIIIAKIVEALAGTESEPANLAELGVAVSKLPHFRAEYEPYKGPAPARVYVGFSGHRFGTEKEPTDILVGSPGQDSDPYFAISVCSKNLYQDDKGPGMLMYLYLIKRLVIGLKPGTGGEISLFQTNLIDYKDGLWYYQVLVRIRDFPIIPFTNTRIDPEVLTLLKTVDVDFEPCTTEIVTNVDENIMISTEDGDEILIR